MDKVTQWTSAFLSYRCHEDLSRHCTVPTVHMTRWFVQYLAIYLQSWQFGQEHKYFDKSQFLILPNTSVPKCQLLQSFLAKVSLRKEAKKIPRTIIQKWDYQIGRHQTKQIAWSAWLVTITITMTPEIGQGTIQRLDAENTTRLRHTGCTGQEPWISGYGRILMFWRLWVWIPEVYTGWTLICCKNVMFVWKRPWKAHLNGWPPFWLVWNQPKKLLFLMSPKKLLNKNQPYKLGWP